MNKLPDSCYIGKIIPKDNFKNYRDEFTNKVERIRYMYQVSSKTSNYEQNNEEDAVVVINLSLKVDSNIENVIKEISNTINYNLLFEIEYNNQKKYGFYDQKLFTTSYNDSTSFDLIANTTIGLYESLKKQIIGNTTKQLSAQELIERQLEVDRITKEIEKLNKEKVKEKQVNKKNKIRKKIRDLKEEYNV